MPGQQNQGCPTSGQALMPAAITAMDQSLIVFHFPCLNGALLHDSCPVSRLCIVVFGEEMMGTGGHSVWGRNVADFVSRVYSGASRHVCTSHSAFQCRPLLQLLPFTEQYHHFDEDTKRICLPLKSDTGTLNCWTWKPFLVLSLGSICCGMSSLGDLISLSVNMKEQ